ncbi:MAG: peroxiredoxin [Acaryochloridaceae cyanobacterium SU_2_1]|nr:peroxiredoxin [Acaryochloridaceae cyanobacterium SU_2_1]
MALTTGAPAPAFTAKDTLGNTVSLSDFTGKTVVLYFYPKDDTPGCTMEACNFRDNYSAYQNKDIVVLGVSGDDQVSHQQFTDKFELPFPLLADQDKAIIKAYDVDGGGYAQRVTYVINSQGNIDKVYTSVNAGTHAADILADLGL